MSLLLARSRPGGAAPPRSVRRARASRRPSTCVSVLSSLANFLFAPPRHVGSGNGSNDAYTSTRSRSLDHRGQTLPYDDNNLSAEYEAAPQSSGTATTTNVNNNDWLIDAAGSEAHTAAHRTMELDPNDAIVRMKPKKWADSWELAVEALKTGRVVILNTMYLPDIEAQRAVDFLSGCVCVTEGNIENLGERIFAFLPYGGQMTSIIPPSALDDEDVQPPHVLASRRGNYR